MAASVTAFAQSGLDPAPNQIDPVLNSPSDATTAVPSYVEYDKKVRTSEQLGALTSSLFGDSVSPYLGQTEFDNVDIDIPGNSALPVQLRRRFVVSSLVGAQGHAANGGVGNPLSGMGNWDVEVPYIYGVFDAVYKWDKAIDGVVYQRCTTPFYAGTPSGFSSSDVWAGDKVHIPGQGDKPMLVFDPGSSPQHSPSDGQTHKWTTSSFDAFSCVTTSNGHGEGFVMTTPEGVSYTFDYYLERTYPSVKVGTRTDPRVMVFLLASKVTDRFGNWVKYSYDSYGHPTAITSNESGRAIALTYNPSDHSQLASASVTLSAPAQTRTWQYGYTTSPRDGMPELTSVTLPDLSKWAYTYSNAEYLYVTYAPPDAQCQPATISTPGGSFTLGITHPSGSQGTFAFQLKRHKRKYPANELNNCVDISTNPHIDKPDYVDTFSLISKTITDTDTTSSAWAYGYNVAGCGASCETITNRVTQPDNSVIDSTYSNYYHATEAYAGASSTAAIEGSLLQTTTGINPACAGCAAATVVRTQVNAYITGHDPIFTPPATSGPYPGQAFPARYGNDWGSDDPSSSSLRPLQSVTTSQDGATFTRTNLAFDSYARPTQVQMASSLGYSRTETTSYINNELLWILGLVDTKTDSSVAVAEVDNAYDSKLNLTSVTEFGVLKRSMTYNNSTDGTLHTINDGLHTTTLGTFKGGIPTTVTYGDSTSQSAVVDDMGEIRSVTDAMGFTTSYGYDPMGRINSIVYPPGDSVTWNNTAIAYEQITSGEAGITGSHWRQTTTTGNAKKITYYDQRWRPVATTEYDSADQVNTQRYTKRSYDFADRETFTSYPSASSSPSTGTHTDYDVLGRALHTRQDSELGSLVTTIDYLSQSPFTKQVTDPRGNVTTTKFQAFDTPSEEAPMTISAPQGVTIAFARDVFGKPTSMTRSGAYGAGTVSQLRRYVYDSGQRLCKTIEPESGATLQDYDAAGNVAWSTRGSTLTGATCDRLSVSVSDMAFYTYDALNRMLISAYPGGTSSVTQTYFNDGALKTTASNGATWTYSYNKRRLLETESLDYDTQSFLIDWTYDANASLSQLMYPDDMLINFLPNALGQPKQAGPFAKSATYWPNGAMKGFTYGNNIVHGLTQNARQLPLRSNDGTVTDLSYTYDADANVSSITDNAQAGLENRTLGYDGLNRLTSASAPGMWGSAAFTYDPLDNLRTSQVGVRSCTHTIDSATNRLTNLAGSNCASTNYGYDVRGNITARGTQGFTFDRADRMTAATGKESYTYDGLGRRVGVAHMQSAGSKTYHVYSKDGQLLFGFDEDTQRATDYVYLNGSLVARTEGITGGAVGAPATPAAPTVNPTISTDGHYTVTWLPVSGATSYNLTEQANGGAEAIIYSGSALTWSPSSAQPNGTYVYRLQACAGSACSVYSGTVTETVQGGTTSISVMPILSTNGSFTVSWPAASGATSYNLFEQVNGGTGTLAYAGPNLSWSTSGRPDGTFIYVVQGCNGSCGNYSAPVTGTVATGIPTQMDASPNPSTNGTYTVTWGAVTSATAYRLEEQFNGGAWTEVQNAATLSRAFSGKANGTYGYRARACRSATDVSYCGAYAQTLTEVVQSTPPTIPYPPNGVAASPNPSTDGNYTVTWRAPSGATTYQLQEQYEHGDGTWHDLGTLTLPQWSPSPAKTGYGNYLYRVKACNTTGCSAYSQSGQEAVHLPNVLPGTLVMQGITPNPSTTGLYTVSWGAAARATSYELHEYNGTAWSIVTTPLYTAMSWTTPTARVNGYYDYYVIACNLYGCSAQTSAMTEQVQIPAANPMTTPTNFFVSSVQLNAKQTFNWVTVPGASRYEINVHNQSCPSVDNPDYTKIIPANTPLPIKEYGSIPNCHGQQPDSVTFWYTIRACDSPSNCSEFSAVTPATIERNATLVPDAVATAATTTYIHTDALHSPVAETNGAGTVTLRTRYEPYGKTLMPPVQGPGYAGHVVDVSTGLSYMQQRYYDPLAGRFFSTDPVPANAASFNRYWYANNNPYKNIDPDGRYSCVGSKDDCRLLADAMGKLAEAAANGSLSQSQQKALTAVQNFYGAPDEKNGVTVQIGDKGSLPGSVGGTSTQGNETNIGIRADTIANGEGKDTQKFQDRFASTVAHEGQHGLDQRANGMPKNRADEKASEVRAYTSEAALFQGLNSGFGPWLWTPERGLQPGGIERSAENSTNLWCQSPGGNCK